MYIYWHCRRGTMSDFRPVILLAGASKGIGLAATKILLQKFNAIVVALSRTRTPELIALQSSSLLIIECDVTNEVGLSQAVSLTLKTYGRIDGLILNAGTVDPMGRIDSLDNNLDSWKAHFDLNFFSLVSTLKATLPALRKSEAGGRVIFVSSGAAVGGTAGWGPYNAGKAAMNSLCRTLAQEEPTIVSVALRPGMVDTGMQTHLRSIGAAHMTEADNNKFLKAHADGKLVKPEDAGHVIAALVVRAPKKLSGQFVSWDSAECGDFRRE